MKVVVAGGGSTYTPELAEGLARLLPELRELVLLDPVADRLAVVGPLARRIFAHQGHPGGVRWTGDREAALAGANVVIIQLRVGGQQARIGDETFPQELGRLGQETTGAGGLAKALRTVPVALDLARAARRLAAPDAWILDFTNPVGIVTRALLGDGHRVVGLCNIAIGLQRRLAAMLGVATTRVTLEHIGLNHLTWEQAVLVDGVDRLPELLAESVAELAGVVELPVEILRAQRAIPSSYLRYFYCHDAVVAAQRGALPRGAQVARLEAELLARYADPTLHSKPELLAQRGGAFYSEAAVGLIASLRSGDGAVHAANVRNRGTLPFLPEDAVIEASCRVFADGAAALPVRPVDADRAGLIAHVSGYEELAVAAAVHGGRDRVYRALLAHPLIGQHDVAEALTDRLLAMNAAFLPWAR